VLKNVSISTIMPVRSDPDCVKKERSGSPRLCLLWPQEPLGKFLEALKNRKKK
jgi:hypothetical protein